VGTEVAPALSGFHVGDRVKDRRDERWANHGEIIDLFVETTGAYTYAKPRGPVAKVWWDGGRENEPRGGSTTIVALKLLEKELIG
jgi:hypothetical protein